MRYEDEIIEEFAESSKSGNLSDLDKQSILKLVENLYLISETAEDYPKPDFSRIKNQVLQNLKVQQTKERQFAISFLRLAVSAVAIILVIVSFTVGIAIAAMQSLPGDTIYPLKKVVESAELWLAKDPQAKTNLQIRFANNRLDELARILEKNQTGELTSDQAQKIVAQTVEALQKNTAAALSSTSVSKSKSSTLNRLVDLSNKQVAVLSPLLSASSISDEGQVKIALQQAIETSRVSKEQAINNIERAGLKVEDQISIAKPSTTSTEGKITELNQESISIGNSKFFLTSETKYVNIKRDELKLDQTVQIAGEFKEDKTNAISVTLVNPIANPETDTKTIPATQNGNNSGSQ